MKSWIFAAIGIVLGGGYEAIATRDEWRLGSDHVFRAAGAVTAFAVIGAMVGLVIALFLEKPTSTS